MDTRAQLGIMPRALIVLLTIALLAIGAVGGYAIGTVVDADDGDGNTALTYTAPPGVIHSLPTDGSGAPIRLTGDDEVTFIFAWSPDGTRFSYESRPDPDGLATIMIRNADASDPVALSEPFEAPWGAIARPYQAWSPDGSTVLWWAPGLDVVDSGRGCGNVGTFCGQRIWSAPSDGSEPAQVIGDPALDARSPLWTPDGETVIFAGSEGNGGLYGIYRMDADGANVERIGDLGGSGYAFDRHAISPDGTTLAVVPGNGLPDLYLVDLATGEETLIAGSDGDEVEPYWSPDGSMIAFTWLGGFNDPAEAMLYDVASGEVISLGTELYVKGWSPDSRSIVSGENGVVTVVDVTDPTAPVVTEVEGLTEAYEPSYQPLP